MSQEISIQNARTIEKVKTSNKEQQPLHPVTEYSWQVMLMLVATCVAAIAYWALTSNGHDAIWAIVTPVLIASIGNAFVISQIPMKYTAKVMATGMVVNVMLIVWAFMYSAA